MHSNNLVGLDTNTKNNNDHISEIIGSSGIKMQKNIMIRSMVQIMKELFVI